MPWYTGAKFTPIDVNYTVNGCVPRLVVLHIMQGTLTGTNAWFHNPKANASAHFGVGKTGDLLQWVETSSKAWAQGAGNAVAISIECEGKSGERLTDAQVTACAELLAWANKVHGVRLQLTDDPNGRGLGWHGMGGAAWGGHLDCPGAPIVGQRAEILRQAKALVAPATRLTVDGVLGPATVSALQARLGVTVDGVLGPQTFAALRSREAVSMLQTILNGKAI